jgi:hypothetical protein
MPMLPGEKFKATNECFPIAFFAFAYSLWIPGKKKIVWGAKIISHCHHY